MTSAPEDGPEHTDIAPTVQLPARAARSIGKIAVSAGGTRAALESSLSKALRRIFCRLVFFTACPFSLSRAAF